ncbi:hypothetical protein NA995_22675, partial [Salmonella sp. NW160]
KKKERKKRIYTQSGSERAVVTTMASLSVSKTLLFNFSRAFPQSQPSLPFHSKVSRVCFASASKSEGIYAGGEGSRNKTPWTSSSDVEVKANEVKDKAKGWMKETGDRTREGSEETKESAKETKGQAAEKWKEGTGKAAETSENAKEKAQDHAYNVNEKTKEAAEKAKEGAYKAKETAGTEAEKAKEGTYKAGETVAEKTGKAAETSENAKEKTQD